MSFDDLLGLIADEDEREEFVRLAARYDAARRQPTGGRPQPGAGAEARQRELLDRLLDRLGYHFRAIRHPLPSADELAAMIGTHFAARPPG